MITRPIHLAVHMPHLKWAQIEFGLLATLCAGGYLFAIILALCDTR